MYQNVPPILDEVEHQADFEPFDLIVIADPDD